MVTAVKLESDTGGDQDLDIKIEYWSIELGSQSASIGICTSSLRNIFLS